MSIVIGVLLPSHITGEHCEIIGEPIIQDGIVYHYQAELTGDYVLPEGEGLYAGNTIIYDEQYANFITDLSIVLQE